MLKTRRIFGLVDTVDTIGQRPERYTACFLYIERNWAVKFAPFLFLSMLSCYSCPPWSKSFYACVVQHPIPSGMKGIITCCPYLFLIVMPNTLNHLVQCIHVNKHSFSFVVIASLTTVWCGQGSWKAQKHSSLLSRISVKVRYYEHWFPQPLR